MNGKKKCKILKDIRREIAEKNDINLVIEECKHKGDCSGTCPRCEAEVRYLEKELEKRRALGKTVAIAGLVATLAATSVGCTLFPEQQVMGDFAPDPASKNHENQERYAATSPSLLSLLNMNEEEKTTYLSTYTRDQIREEWRGRLVDNENGKDTFKIPLYQKEYYVKISYSTEGTATTAEIELIEEKTTKETSVVLE